MLRKIIYTISVALMACLPWDAKAQECSVPRGFVAINSPAEFAAIDNALDGKYILCQDIDFTNATFSGIGHRPSDPEDIFGRPTVKPFTGVLLGNGHVIRGFVPPSVPQSEREVGGLFAALHRATVRDLTISDAATFGYNSVGVLAGSINRSKVFSVKIVSSTVGTSGYSGSFSNLGLLGGSCTSSTIRDVELEGVVRGVRSAGSLCGVASGSNVISRVVARGEVLGRNPADAALASHQTLGGLLGRASDSLSLSASGFEGRVASLRDSSSGFDGYTFYGGVIGNASLAERLTIREVWFTGEVVNIAAEFGFGPDWEMQSYTGGAFGFIDGRGEVSDVRIEATVEGGQPGGVGGDASGPLFFRRILTLGRINQSPFFSERVQLQGGAFARAKGIRAEKVLFNATLNPSFPGDKGVNGVEEWALRGRATYNGWSMSEVGSSSKTRWKIVDGVSFPVLMATK